MAGKRAARQRVYGIDPELVADDPPAHDRGETQSISLGQDA
jgi:hypothetical protein